MIYREVLQILDRGRDPRRQAPGSEEDLVLRRTVAVAAVVAIVVAVIAVVVIAVPAVVPVVAPAAVAAAAVVAGELGHHVVDPLHATVDVRPRADGLHGDPQLIEGLLQPGELVRRAAGIAPVALHLVVEVGG